MKRPNASFVMGATCVCGLLLWGVAGIVRDLREDSRSASIGQKSSIDDAQGQDKRSRGGSLDTKRTAARGRSRVAEHEASIAHFLSSDDTRRHIPLPSAQVAGEVSPKEAEEAFFGALAALDRALDDDVPSDDDHRAMLFNQATGSFTALSRHVDAGDPEQRRRLEDAYTSMRERMAALGFDGTQDRFGDDRVRDSEERGKNRPPSLVGGPPG